MGRDARDIADVLGEQIAELDGARTVRSGVGDLEGIGQVFADLHGIWRCRSKQLKIRLWRHGIERDARAGDVVGGAGVNFG